jgi:hypothetical protein
MVGAAVTGPVEPVAVGAARGCRDGRGAAEVGEGGLGAEPLGVVTGGDQQLPGGVDPDPRQGQQGGRGRGDQFLELTVELVEFAFKAGPAGGRLRRPSSAGRPTRGSSSPWGQCLNVR